jgi:tRNA A37 threonylcarbamoyladenosine dehydratase
MSKADALARRVADIHPGCEVHGVEEFADDTNWPGLLPVAVDAVIDACDQSRAKLALAAWALQYGMPYVCCGAAGGKRRAELIEVDDLSATTHDPLLASLRQRLRSGHGAARSGRIGLRCVFSRESITPPQLEAQACVPAALATLDAGDALYPGDAQAAVRPARGDNSLNCHGYGSTVTVTASFGMAAAGETISQLQRDSRL